MTAFARSQHQTRTHTRSQIYTPTNRSTDIHVHRTFLTPDDPLTGLGKLAHRESVTNTRTRTYTRTRTLDVVPTLARE